VPAEPRTPSRQGSPIVPWLAAAILGTVTLAVGFAVLPVARNPGASNPGPLLGATRERFGRAQAQIGHCRSEFEPDGTASPGDAGGRRFLYVLFVESAADGAGIDSATEAEIRHDWRPQPAGRAVSAVYWHHDGTIGIGSQTFDLDQGRVFLLRRVASEVASVRQVDIAGPSIGPRFPLREQIESIIHANPEVLEFLGIPAKPKRPWER